VRGALLAFPRQALHAASLGFRHPISGQALHFESSPPADMAGLIKLLDGNTE
jgi:23S rRNA pseudouridine1911/1915/1917 synthase